jgi:Helix-turn-helix domain
MSHRHINHVRDHSRTKGSAKSVLLAIATRVDGNGLCFPSLQRLAQDSGLSVSTVRRAIKQIPRDELEIVERGGTLRSGERCPTKYRVITPNGERLGDKSGTKAKRSDDPDRVQSDSPTIVNLTDDNGQNGYHDRGQFDHVTEKAEKNKEQKRLTEKDVVASNGNSKSSTSITPDKKASVLLHNGKAGKPGSELPWALADEELEELQEFYSRLGDIRRFIRQAALKCSAMYPTGGPMGYQFFKKYLANLQNDLPPPGYEEGRRWKKEEAKPCDALSQFIQAVSSHTRPDYESGWNTPVPAPPPKPPLASKARPEPVSLDPQSRLETWKQSCPDLASDFQRFYDVLKAEPGDWNSNKAKRLDRRCGERLDQYLRQPKEMSTA